MGLFGMPLVELLWLSYAVVLVLKLSKLKNCEVECCVPLAHQGWLWCNVRHQVKEQAWCAGQLQQHRAQRARVLAVSISLLLI